MKRLMIVFCFGLVAACGGTSPSGGGGGGSTGGSGGSGGTTGTDAGIPNKGMFLGSCVTTLGGDKTCNDFYAGTASSGDADAKKANPCDGNSSVLKPSPSTDRCDSTGNTGSCQKKTTEGLVQTTWYFSSNVDTEKNACTSGNGTWVNP